MSTRRLEAFSDGVLAIIITVMVFKIEAPSSGSLDALVELAKPIASFFLSFLYLGIYWNNHHHLIQVTERVDGVILWANLHLLFWLSLLPFATHWLNEAGATPATVATYGVILLGAGVAYRILCWAVLRLEPKDSLLSSAIGRDSKGFASLGLYMVALAFAAVRPYVSIALYAVVAGLWARPDRRIEQALSTAAHAAETIGSETYHDE